MNISQGERGGNGDSLGVVNQWFLFGMSLTTLDLAEPTEMAISATGRADTQDSGNAVQQFLRQAWPRWVSLRER